MSSEGSFISKDLVDPLLEGLAIYGTGGGGSTEFGRKILQNDFDRDRSTEIVDPEEIENDAFVVSGGILGSVKEIDNISFDEVIARWEEGYELTEALNLIEDYFDERVDYLVPFELGGLNTPAILSLGAREDIPVVNGDALGRAAPATHMTSFFGHGVSITPMAMIDDDGDSVLISKTQDAKFPDQLGRWMVTRSHGMGANNHYPMTGEEFKSSVIPETIKEALELGRLVMDARESGRNPVDAVVEETEGSLLINEGVVSEIEEEDKGGFLLKKVLVEKKDDVVELFIKNEVMVCKKNGEVRCIFPDLALILDSETGRGLMSTELEEGLKLNLVTTGCHPRLRKAARTERGKIAFDPGEFGFDDLEYKPLEQLGGNNGG